MQYVLEHKSELGLTRAYMMFADQDDIWAANKIEIEFKSLLLLETGDGYRMPALVHSDLEVVDFEGKRIAASYIAYQGLQRQRDSLVNQVQSNLVTGCTAVINEELALKVLPIPDQAIMHDWWIAIAAVAYGRRLFIDQCLVRYRQHGRNTIGASRLSPRPLQRNLYGGNSGLPRPILICLQWLSSLAPSCGIMVTHLVFATASGYSCWDVSMFDQACCRFCCFDWPDTSEWRALTFEGFAGGSTAEKIA